MANKKHESPHILAYIMEIDKAIRNGEFPNASSMNKKMGWTIKRERKSGIQQALDDVEAGRVHEAKNVDDLMEQLNA